MKTRLCSWACVALAACGTAAAQDPAANYPSRPVTLIFVVTAGGTAESELRVYVPRLQENLGKPVVFDYKPGAGGAIGFSAGAKSAPDGYTLVATTPAFTTTPALAPNAGYDPVRDFAPVVQTGRSFGMLVAHPGLPATNMQELLAYARANPGKLNFGTTGVGSTPHLVGAWMADLTQTDITFVHYKGTTQVMTDMLGGVLQVSVGSIITQGPQVKAGKLRALAITGAARAPSFPDVRTTREQGLGDFDYPAWVGVIAPAKTPPAIINKVNAEFNKIQKLPETLAQLDRLGTLAVGGPPADFARLINDETSRWKAVVKKTGIQAEN